MGFLPKGIFNKTGALPKPADQTTPSQPQPQRVKPKKTAFRGPGGKFVSKKAPAAASRMQTIALHGHTIRMFLYENEQYYCADDLVKASGMVNPEQFLKDLLAKEQNINQELAEVKTEENGAAITLQFAKKQQMILIIAAIEKVSPKTIPISLENLS